MTEDAAKVAFKKKVPVVCGGIEYSGITALICRHDEKNGGFKMQCELLDKGQHAIVIASPKDITLATGENN